ncbi:hypothetical protein E4U17_004234 [Claviceps sp. LM77 group G4]|nr:hypothetical protein E4U17_004234 [Claviceps sp. LM77 group G4]KAG6080958.1 hypothetical protein E4U16_007980 [Claviceps sp. LM84 group G4]KAG6086325.1 hypothetical protein E4U33_006144 [Claviceps sp. LM78 group G4]
MPKRPSQRPLMNISAPQGPVKTSRGPDLIRSEGLELVDSIKDCESGASTPATSISVASRRSRRISASFLSTSTAAPSTSPIVAASDIKAVTYIQATKASKPSSFGRRPALLSLSTRSLLKQPSRYTLVAQSSPLGVENEENVAPWGAKQSPVRDMDLKPTSSLKQESKLPRSRTMTVLQGLKKSFSRPSLAPARTFSLGNKMTPSKISPTAQRADYTSSPLALTLSSSPLSSASTARTPTPHDATPRSAASRPQPEISQVDAAQSAEYWCGRFMALQDRFLSENLDDSSLTQYSSRVDSQWRHTKLVALGHQSLLPTSRNHLTYLAPSNTTSALTTITYNPRRRLENEDDIRRDRIFSHLESLCVTDEAMRSLRLWQQSYEHRVGSSKVPVSQKQFGGMDRKKMLLGSVSSRFKSIEVQDGVVKRKPIPSPRRGAAFALKHSSSHGAGVF